MLENELLQTQIDVWVGGLESDEMETFAKIEQNLEPTEDPEELSDLLNRTMNLTSCGGNWVNILKHLLLLPSNPFTKLIF